MRYLAIIFLMATAFPLNAFTRDPNVQVCAELSSAPSSGNADTAIMAFGASSFDYWFSGLVEVAMINGQPAPSEKNRVIYAVQSMMFKSENGTQFLVPDHMNMSFRNGRGFFELGPLNKGRRSGFPNAPIDKIESSIVQTYPIFNCLSEAQLDWTKWQETLPLRK